METMYVHVVSGDIMTREEALEMIQEAQENEFDEVYGMSEEDALNHSFVEIENDQ